MNPKRFWAAMAVAWAAAAGTAQAADDSPWEGHMMGPGMMGGQGRMGPGMMEGQGRMGPGMRGYRPGTGGPGVAPGMGPFNPWGADLNLSDEQSRAISRVLEQTRAKHWRTQARMMEAMNALQEAYDAPQPDPDEVGEAYEQVLRLQKERAVDDVQARNRIYDLLNEEQREKLRRNPYGGARW